MRIYSLWRLDSTSEVFNTLLNRGDYDSKVNANHCNGDVESRIMNF